MNTLDKLLVQETCIETTALYLRRPPSHKGVLPSLSVLVLYQPGASGEVSRLGGHLGRLVDPHPSVQSVLFRHSTHGSGNGLKQQQNYTRRKRPKLTSRLG